MNVMFSFSPNDGRFGCIALQVHRKTVAKDVQSKSIVPRPSGLGAQLTIVVVEFVDMRLFGSRKTGTWGLVSLRADVNVCSSMNRVAGQDPRQRQALVGGRSQSVGTPTTNPGFT